tara:strand:+ start:5621 stop:5818 length:198 start_codon:yes stop_codon:yes gene_type:complete
MNLQQVELIEKLSNKLVIKAKKNFDLNEFIESTKLFIEIVKTLNIDNQETDNHNVDDNIGSDNEL